MKKTKFLLLCIPVVLLASSCLFTPKVESCFTFAANGNTVTFSSGCSENGESYQWDFGDGETSLQPNPTHTYATAGNYTVILNVTGKKGRTESTSSIVSIVGCSPACVNGTCVNNACDCDAGYEGTACDVAVNEKFNGTYSANENCSLSGSYVYTVTVTPSSNSQSSALIFNLYDTNVSLLAVIGADGTSFTIASQNAGFGTIESIGAHGTISANGSSIALTFRATNTTSGQSEDCTTVLTRQ